MKGIDVICPGCKTSFHTTTDKYDPDKTARGDMVSLKDPWRKWGWCSFGDADNGLSPAMAERESTYWSMMDCPGCGAPLAPNGNLTVQSPEPAETLTRVDKALDEFFDDGVQKLNTETRDEKVLRLKAEGLSYAKIGEAVGLSKGRVYQIVKNEKESA